MILLEKKNKQETLGCIQLNDDFAHKVLQKPPNGTCIYSLERSMCKLLNEPKNEETDIGVERYIKTFIVLLQHLSLSLSLSHTHTHTHTHINVILLCFSSIICDPLVQLSLPPSLSGMGQISTGVLLHPTIIQC